MMSKIKILELLVVCLLCFSCEQKNMLPGKNIKEKKELNLVDFDYLKLSNQVVLKGDKDSWDQSIRECGNFINLGNKLIQVYSGYKDDYKGNNVYVGLSYSTDNGETWTKGGTNGDGKIIERSLEDPYIVYDSSNKVYYLYAEDKEERPFQGIRLYSSKDLLDWIDLGCVLNKGEIGIDSKDVSSPFVIKKDGEIHLFYEARGKFEDGKKNWGIICRAISNDYVNFTKYDKPVFSGNNYISNSKWCSHLVSDDIVKANNKYYMTYHGYSTDDKLFAVGLAVSDDLDTWSDLGRIKIDNDNIYQDDVMFIIKESQVNFVVKTKEKQRVLAYPTFN